MNQKRIAAILFVSLGLVVLWGILAKKPSVPTEEPKAQAAAGPQLDTEPSQSNIHPASDAATTVHDPRKELEHLAQTKGVPLDVLTQGARVEVSNMANEMSQTINRPIQFYGKAVDENGQPIASAKVHFGCVVYPNAHIGTNVVTDVQGTFSLGTITGTVLNVQVSKDGYKVVNESNQTTFTYYSPLGTPGFNADPNNPVVFHMQRQP